MIKVFSLVVTLTAMAAPAAEPPRAWRLETGLEAPESAHYSSHTDRIYVSSIAGGPTDFDRRGWISVVRTDGKLEEEKWVQGLNAPKGIATSGDRLWVTDIDTV